MEQILSKHAGRQMDDTTLKLDYNVKYANDAFLLQIVLTVISHQYGSPKALEVLVNKTE